MDEVITKRIHISGLTPAITAKDLSDRLGLFGTVKALDGLGALDALGQPRKFAYATLETTKGKLARCMNLLSGVTWKGAKLRLGDAKPDFRERIAKEHGKLKRAAEEAANQPPKKRRRLPRGVQGVYASDMSLVTPENAPTRGGWRVTATGRLIRPIRMRPEHPLPDAIEVAKPEKGKGKLEKGKKRARDPPTRARRRTIDPTKWGSTHIKGIFLENAAATIPLRRAAKVDEQVSERDDESEESSGSEEAGSEEESEEEDVAETVPDHKPSGARTAKAAASASETDSDVPPPQTRLVVTSASQTRPPPAGTSDIAEEASKALDLLQSLFGDKEEWGGQESVGSDVDEEDLRRAREDTALDSGRKSADVEDDNGSAMQVDVPAVEADSIKPAPPAQAPRSEKTKLKDLFAPREEEAGFSLLGHLDLDLELEDDVPFDLPVDTPGAVVTELLRSVQPTVAAHVPRAAVLDSSKPLFFPSDNAASIRRVIDPTGWRTWFYRTDSPEAIRQRWEDSKSELTAGWKRRHREAIKSRRRRGGAVGEAD